MPAQAPHPGIEQAHSPHSLPDRRRRDTLPLPFTPLIGREQEVRTLEELLLCAQVRMVTLHGPAGVGKTRLSLQVARQLQPAFPDGVYFVALAAVRDPELVLPTLAQSIELRETKEQPLIKQLEQLWREQQALLVLDNFEQVLAAAADVARLLASCPGLKVLVTSRTVLRISAERRFSVPPLALPDLTCLPDPQALAQHAAIRLFIERARLSNPTFSLTEANAAVVAEICYRLDGLPLAIELATARLRLLSPHALLARLSSRLALLTDGARDLLAHQQTLRSTIDWSYEILTPAEQQLFMRLATFAGGCTLEAAEAVCAMDDAVGSALIMQGLASLLDKSILLQQPGDSDAGAEPRFRMLETIGEYALERLTASGELAAVQQRHANYFLSLAEQAEPELVGPRQAYWLNRLEQEHDNLRAALQWALDQREVELALRIASAVWRFWHVHGYLGEGRRWLEAALAASPDARTRTYARALCGAGWMANVQGEIEQARSRFQQSLELCLALQDPQGAGLALAGVGRMAHLQGDYARATALYAEGLALFRQLGDIELQGWSLNRLGLLALEQGQLSRAVALFEEGLALFRQLDYRWGITWSLIYLGSASLEQGDYRRATTLFEESLACVREFGDREMLATSLTNLGRAAFYQGNVDQAAARSQEGLVLYQALGARLGIAECLEVLAHATWARMRTEHAVQLLAAAELLRADLGVPPPPAERTRIERLLRRARVKLGQPTFECAWAAGRSMTPAQLVAALEAPLRVQLPASARASRQASTDRSPWNLTVRELQVLRLVATGLTDAEIANLLVLSPRTINAHLRSIYSKLGVSSRSAATRLAIEQKLT